MVESRCGLLCNECSYREEMNDKPTLLVCDNTVYVKILDCISAKMEDAE
ncbi:MAG: hypothetical protein AAGU27_03680 [Dehalobacterium sp.]